MSVRRAQQEITSREFAEWSAMDRIDARADAGPPTAPKMPPKKGPKKRQTRAQLEAALAPLRAIAKKTKQEA